MKYGREKAGRGKPFFFVLIGLFLLLAPLSVSGGRSQGGDDILKWARVATLAVIGLYGLQWFRVGNHSPVTLKLLVFAGFFSVSAAWSTSPVWGLAFKGMFFAAVVGGITLGNCLRSEADFRAFARSTTTTATIALAGVVFIILTQENDIMLKGRLWVGQMNPNLLAQSSTVFALLCMFHLLVPDRRGRKTQAGLCLIAMLVITLLTGSRGASLMLFSGIIFLLPAFGRKRRQVLLLASCSGLVLLFLAATWFESTDSGTLASPNSHSVTLRIVDKFTKDTRGKIWGSVISRAMDSPIIGTGWLNYNNRAANVQSAYLQVFAESGFVGLGLLAIFLLAAFALIYRNLRLGRKQTGLNRSLMLVFSATAAAMLLHGAFESSLVTGASPNAIILGFCVSQLDYLRGVTERGQRSNQATAIGFHQPGLAAS